MNNQVKALGIFLYALLLALVGQLAHIISEATR
jgi:hypothetical protein